MQNASQTHGVVLTPWAKGPDALGPPCQCSHTRDPGACVSPGLCLGWSPARNPLPPAPCTTGSSLAFGLQV